MAPIPSVRTERVVPPPPPKPPPPPPKPELKQVDNPATDPSRLSRLSDLNQFGEAQRLRIQNTAIQPLAAQTQVSQTPANEPDKAVDGNFLGADGKTYPPNTPLSEIPAVVPEGGVRNNETIIYTNGILNNTDDQYKSLQAIAEQTGSRVIGVRNATDGFVGDAAQVFNDRVDRLSNPAVDTLADTVYDELKKGNPVHLMAHSQGGIVTSRALTDVKNRLVAEDGLTIAQAEEKMGNIQVETFGAAARSYTDGPQYVHYIRKNDAVPQSLGLGSNNYSDAPYPGKDAVVHEFETKDEPIFGIPHGFNEYSIPERVPFDQARAGNFNPEPDFGLLDIPKNLAIDARNSIVEEVTPILHGAEGAVELVRTGIDKAIEAWNFTKDNAIQAWNFTKDKAIEGWNFTKDKAVEAWDFTKEKAIEAWDFTKNKATQAWDFTKDKASEAWNFTKDKATDFGNAVSDTASDVKDWTSDRFNDAKKFFGL